ncbi:hypothetical protein [Stella sp.]|uniref:hypothetical protein n=1 Tax=Stella sp. TaxID=2912054 RepID=UPI0035B3BD9C
MSLRALLALAALLAAPAASWAAEIGPFGLPTAPYAADSRITADGRTVTARIHADGARERREIRDGDLRQVMLIDHDAKRATMLIVEQKVAMEVDMDATGGPMAETKWETRELGREELGGRTVTRHHVDGRGADGARVVGEVWLTDERIPVKSSLDVTEEGQTVRIVQELSNLRIGPVDPALFQVPAGYQKVPMPAGGQAPTRRL